MGYLSDGGGSGSDSGSAEVPAAAEAAAEAPAVETAPAEGAPGEQLQVSEPAPRTERVAIGRRGKAAAATTALETQLKTLTATITQQGHQTAAAIAARDAQIAELRGGFGALAPFLQQQRQPAGPPPPDSAALMREAKKLLDANDFDGYQSKYKEAITADILSQIPRQQAQAPAQGPDPVVMAMASQFPAVINNGKRGFDLAVVKDQELAIMGYPNGPERYRKAFELASNQLAPQQGAQYSQQSRQVLSGTPTSRPAGGASTRGEGVTLNEWDIKWRDAAGMTNEEYAKFVVESDPSRIER